MRKGPRETRGAVGPPPSLQTPALAVFRHADNFIGFHAHLVRTGGAQDEGGEAKYPMSDVTNSNLFISSWLLLDDGHAVPIKGLSPDGIKAAREAAIPFPETPLQHTTGLNAIAKKLGSRGGFAGYQTEFWPALEAFLRTHGCRDHRELFAGTRRGFDWFVNPLNGVTKRNLADRLFHSDLPQPSRVFVGYGVDWAWWDENTLGADGYPAHSLDDFEYFADLPVRDELDFRKRLASFRNAFIGQWGFLDNKLVEGPVDGVVDKTYWQTAFMPLRQEREKRRSALLELTRRLRSVFDSQTEGWLEVLPFGERLAILRAHDGSWDAVWPDLRDEEPPNAGDIAARYKLHILDTPIRLRSGDDLARSLYFRTGAWDEKECHEAEQFFCASGGKAAKHPGLDAVRQQYLVAHGQQEPTINLGWQGPPPRRFATTDIGDRSLLVTPMVTVAEFRQMMEETGYDTRRADNTWERANPSRDGSLPVCVTWNDAMAYCAWLERQLRVAVRLLTRDEHRALRPIHSQHYENLTQIDFPWESWPPRPLPPADNEPDEARLPVPSAVVWSEPRFLEPGPDVPEFPSSNGIGRGSRRRWIKDFPPSANWSKPLPFAKYGGLAFIDAWDAYEWCEHAGRGGVVVGRFWEGPFALRSWGDYKNMKITFRVALDVEGAPDSADAVVAATRPVRRRRAEDRRSRRRNSK